MLGLICVFYFEAVVLDVSISVIRYIILQAM